MDDLVRFEIIKLPKSLIVGKELRYSDELLNKGDNRLPGFWEKCCGEDIFAPLDAQPSFLLDSAPVGVFLDWDLGDGDFSYIVGRLMKVGVTVPQGYFVRELPQTDAALCWIKCKDLADTRTVPFASTAKAIMNAGRSCGKMKWCMDLYHPLRSTQPDENGDVVLDCYVPLD